ncbi:tetratricopeptide repeat protein 30A [Cimex lectularius]|uniref:Tetratricopeptide repeat protein 30 n=1 Tax=Cimex lectularius TaxID=79782 RepID=A0A8I6RBT8_CIMLE|nr:tetratricopeptide repeat protein 30A [Cimex lectularius]
MDTRVHTESRTVAYTSVSHPSTNMYMHNYTIKDGDYTKAIYTMIKEQRFNDAVMILRKQLDNNENSRACLSLLAYCYFNTQDFINSAEYYERLAKLVPNETDYKLHHAQALYQACLYEKAMKVLSTITDQSYHNKVTKLKAAIKYGEEDLISARALLENSADDEPETEINHACILYKEERYQEALPRFSTALLTQGYDPHLSYSLALCYYKIKDYSQAVKYIAEIMERGIREHPELGVGMATEGIEFRSVGNTMVLHETALIEAFNLKAALEFKLGNLEAAREALTDMPPRSEEELDAVTLHNQALMNMEMRPTEGFEKLQFLLQQNPFPPETLGNLLILYCKYGYFNLAADVIAENQHLTQKYLSQYLYSFIDALITQQTSPDDAYKKFEEIAVRHTESLRKATKRVQEARNSQDDAAAKRAVADYEETLDSYIPVLMAQAKIYWDLEQYHQVESIFQKSVEFCNENDTWRLQVANVLFIQDNKYKEAIGFYEPIVKKSYANLLNVSPVVLANLCVSYIMSAMNEEAEELMRKIEKEEERLHYEEPDKKVFHLSIVNLIIGTLYCAKGNYEFGISRLIRSLEPYNKKLSPDTWYYTKRCVLSLIENMAKRIIFPTDSFFQDCLDFLDNCEVFGKDVKTSVENPLEDVAIHEGRNTVAYESRLLKELLVRVNIPNALL